jgi:hypothetical protein
VIESNWHVCEQLPAGGEAVQDSPRLTVERSCPDAVSQAEGTDPDSESAAAAVATAPTQPETSAPMSAPSSASTTEPTTTVPAATAPPTTDYELSEDEMKTLVFPIVFDTFRDGVIEILDGNFVVQTVDRYVYDSDNGTVLVDITPAFDFDEGVRDDAWEIMRAMSELWTAEAWVDPTHAWSPSLDVSISTAQYRCTGDQMRLMQDARFGRSDWETSCRIR